MSFNTLPANPFPPSSEQMGAGGGGGSYVLPTASANTLGGVKIGDNITISESGAISAPAPYSLPTASAETLGGIKVGSGLSIADGVLSASGGSSVDYSTTEREVGEYFGKKLYEKSYKLFENGVAQYPVQNNEYQIAMTGYDDVFIPEVVGVRSDAGDTYVDTMCSGAELITVFNKTDGNIYMTSGHTYSEFIAVVRYTKQSA